MAIVIGIINNNEKKHFILSNKILELKNTLIERQYKEVLYYSGILSKTEIKQLRLKTQESMSEINKSLSSTYLQLITQTEKLMRNREVQKGKIEQNRKGVLSNLDIIDDYYTKLIKTDNRIILIYDNIRDDSIAILQKRERQKKLVLVFEVILISILSTIFTLYLRRGILQPIERLKTYALSINGSEIPPQNDSSTIDKIAPVKNSEFSKLAEIYLDLEDRLLNKMLELHDRKNSLTRELKERKEAEKELRNTKKYLTNIIQSINSIIITIDNNLEITHFNDPAEKLTINKGKQLYKRFPVLEQFNNEIVSVLDTNESQIMNSVEIKPLDHHYFNIHITPLIGDKMEGLVIRLDDITNIRNIENQLVTTQKWETLGVLTSGFAHDFNNVLTGVVTSSSILLYKAEEEYPDLDKAFIDCLKIIDKSGKRAAAMVQQLLSLSKNNELVFSNLDLNMIVEDVKSLCNNSFDKVIDIHTELLGRIIPVKADGVQIEQVILNLCINAYHSMTEMRSRNEKHCGTLTIALKELHIDNFYLNKGKNRKNGDYISISIRDTGIGINKELKDKIFDPFFTTKDKTKGSGLGLTMAQHIVTQHNGFIDLYSEPGRGTIVTVSLPVSNEAYIDDKLELKNRRLIPGDGTILIIDDEEIIRSLSKSILVQCGYNVITAEDGFKGVNIYKQKRNIVDLVILDMSMPGISGKETFIELKQINPEQKIMIASGFAKDDRIQDLINMGLEDFIQKPFDFIELSQKTAYVIKQE